MMVPDHEIGQELSRGHWFVLYRGRCLVLDDWGGTLLHALLATRRFDLQAFFPMALSLVTALSELHRREIIHNHINPGRILVHTATGDVCFTDLSLSSQAVGETQAPPKPPELSGTLVYRSPEQTGRMNRAVDYRTDFYAACGGDRAHRRQGHGGAGLL